MLKERNLKSLFNKNVLIDLGKELRSVLLEEGE